MQDVLLWSALTLFFLLTSVEPRQGLPIGIPEILRHVNLTAQEVALLPDLNWDPDFVLDANVTPQTVPNVECDVERWCVCWVARMEFSVKV